MLGRELGLGVPREYNRPSDTFVLPKCLIGCEFEFENVTRIPSGDWMEFYKQERDGSLRGHSMEYIFARPLLGADAEEAIRGLCTFAKENKYAASIRTGFHVHVDVRDLDYLQLQRLIVLNALLEPALYRYAGDNREENVFCLPWYSADAIVKDIKELYTAKGAALKAIAKGIYNKKYTGCNLDPLHRFGSVEFRHLRVTTDAERLIKWINICLRIKEAAMRMTVAPEALVNKTLWGSVPFWQEVLQVQADHLLVGADFIKDIKAKSLAVAAEIVRPIQGFPKIWPTSNNDQVTRFLTSKGVKPLAAGAKQAARGRDGIPQPIRARFDFLGGVLPQAAPEPQGAEGVEAGIVVDRGRIPVRNRADALVGHSPVTWVRRVAHFNDLVEWLIERGWRGITRINLQPFNALTRASDAAAVLEGMRARLLAMLVQGDEGPGFGNRTAEWFESYLRRETPVPLDEVFRELFL